MSLLGISVWGLCPILKLLQFQAREEIEHTLQQLIPDNKLAVFENPETISGFAWEKTGKEFHCNGSMYDVVRTKKKNDKTLYYCINDKKEAKIFSCLQGLVDKQMDNGNTSTGAANHYLIKLLVQVFVLFEKNDFSIMRFKEHCHYSYQYTFQCKASYTEIVSPPPDLG